MDGIHILSILCFPISIAFNYELRIELMVPVFLTRPQGTEQNTGGRLITAPTKNRRGTVGTITNRPMIDECTAFMRLHEGIIIRKNMLF